jgi:UDP-glucose 4-epimerase
MNILVTGGAGYIGSHTALSLLDKGHKVSIIDNLITGSKKVIPKKANFYKCDISNKEKVSNIIKKNNFDAVIHFAGLIKVEDSVMFPKKYNLFNYLKTKIFLETCIKNNLNNIIFSSTASVYGNGNIKKNFSESSSLKPINPYAKSKLKVEKYLKKKFKEKKINFMILRYFNVAGADLKLRSGLIDKKSSHLIKVACEVATNKKNFLTINGKNFKTRDKTAIRDYIHVLDLADIHVLAIIYLLKKKKSQILNCGYGKGFSILEIIKSLNKILKKPIKYKIGPRRKGDTMKVVANCSKIKKILRWKPKYNKIELILKSALKWEKKIQNLK